MIRNFINGMCMAYADSVPGVSGGTIAFIMGFYDDFIKSIDELIYGRRQERKKALIYLAKLGVGWITGMISAVLIISSAFENHIYFISSLFIGFVLISVPVIIKEEKDTLRGRYREMLFVIPGVLLVVAATVLNGVSSGNISDLSALSIPMALYIFFAGMIAISAMFLPGLSGSSLLLIAGLYVPVISGIKDVLHLNFASFPALLIFGVGVITGAVTVVKLIMLCLEHFRAQTLYTVIGLIIGSVYAIVMGPTTLKKPAEPLSFTNFSLLACIIGIALVLLIQKSESRRVG